MLFMVFSDSLRVRTLNSQGNELANIQNKNSAEVDIAPASGKVNRP